MTDPSGGSLIQQAFGLTVPKIQFNLDVFKQLLTQWMVGSNVSFHQVQDPSFRLLLSYLTAVNASYTAIPSCLPRCGITVRAWIVGMYTQQKQKLMKELDNANKVNFTYDLWSSPNHMALLGITAHWINPAGSVCHALLGLRPLHGAHIEEN